MSNFETQEIIQSLDFTENRFFFELFDALNIGTITECQLMFYFDSQSVQIATLTHELEASFGRVS